MATIITEKDSAQVKSRGSTTTTEIELDKEKPAHKSPDLLDQENAIDSSPDSDEPAPDGGARAWTVAAGGAAILFCCLGFANSFGVFEQYYLTHQLQGHSPDKIAWVGSISAYLQFGAGMVGGPMFDRYGAVIMQPAAVTYVFAVMMLSLCKEFWQIMLVQGVLMGLAMGFLQFPAFAAVSQYFDKKRAAALGIVVAGSSIGGVVIPIALSKMLNNSSLGFGWSVRVIGFLLIPLLGFACVAVRARLTSRTTAFWLARAYTEAIFVLLMVSMFFIFIGMLTPLFYLPTYAVSRGMDPTLAGYLLAIVNASSTFGRIIPGILADKYGRLNVYAIGGISTGITIFCMNSATNNGELIGYAIAFGFTSGTIISGLSACVSLCAKDPREIGMYMGMGMSLSSLGGLIGPPVNGVFVHHYGGFFEACMFSGAMCLFGGFIAVLTKIVTPQGLFGRV
ncbi:hypothetical protein V495_05498 [Pseudogymnoascus sp. VKM F-4514 (FW-929)]|nr:hypothetical protein V495_05498 [Pseudogymnoascus sp. VKM F-4514 (FW-929)]KFY57737.1 hypothetical protein V497_05313 [Pseudogymnoascus sp. VKM F-4516 (FW-969)]